MSTQNSAQTVLLMAYGSPETAADVGAYYTHIRGGARPSEHLIKALEERYALVGGKTPLGAITNEQASALQGLLDARKGAGRFKVFVGMKHWHPSIKDALDEIRKTGAEDVIAIALAPHFSRMSIGGYEKALAEAGGGLAIHLIRNWHTNGHLIDCIVTQIKDALAAGDPGDRPHLVFTAHSLPERIRQWNDPYEEQLLETCRLVAASLPGLEWSFSFQSAGHTSEPWLGPDISEALADLKERGKKNILICPIGFVADNLEILVDLDSEAKQIAQQLGMQMRRADSRNTHPLFIEALYDLVSSGKGTS
jgi:ferrochelatase